MLIPKASSYPNGKYSISFENPEYLQKAQWEKPCLYKVIYDKNDLANLFAPECKETIRLAKESRSKVGDLVKPYEYTKLNNLHDLFVPQQQNFDLLIPLAQRTFTNTAKFEKALKEEMSEDLKYVETLEKEVDDLKKDIDDL
ncbi:hypothetical protein Tco_0478465 [Tanacetum coccineum]